MTCMLAESNCLPYGFLRNCGASSKNKRPFFVCVVALRQACRWAFLPAFFPAVGGVHSPQWSCGAKVHSPERLVLPWIRRLSDQSSRPRGVNFVGMWHVQRLEQINALKPANLLDFKSLTLEFRSKQISGFKTLIRTEHVYEMTTNRQWTT